MFIQKYQQNNAETVMIICFAQTSFKKKIIKYIADDTTMATIVWNNDMWINKFKQGINEFLHVFYFSIETILPSLNILYL